MKKADRNLVIALVTCLVAGVVVLAFSLNIYLRHDLQKNFDQPVPVEVFQPLLDASRILIYAVLPGLGMICLLVGYVIWDYRRKRGEIKEPATPDA